MDAVITCYGSSHLGLLFESWMRSLRSKFTVKPLFTSLLFLCTVSSWTNVEIKLRLLSNFSLNEMFWGGVVVQWFSHSHRDPGSIPGCLSVCRPCGRSGV